MSMMTRFGRTDAALDFVDPSEKQAFAKRREPWEKELRVLDVELVDLRLQSKEEADVVMTVLWQRFNEAEVRETQVTQRWRDSRKGWKLLSESAESGDRELLAEPAAGAKSIEKAGPAKKL